MMQHAVQWNPDNTDIKGTYQSVRVIGVSVLSGLSDKTLRTNVLSIHRPRRTLLQRQNVLLIVLKLGQV